MFMQKALALTTSNIIQLLLKNKMNGLVELHQSLFPTYQGGLNGTHGTFLKDQETQAKASPLYIIPLVSGTIKRKNFEWNDVWCGEHVSTNMKVCT
jgi:hypothetical protein